MSLVWREQLSVGNDVIDNDHKHLIEIINQAELSLHERSREKLAEVFGELESYGNDHFLREELIAKSVSYPNSDLMHKSHANLLIELKKLKEEIGTAWTDQVASHFTSLLRDWLLQHVIKEDMLMKPWMVKYPPNYNPCPQLTHKEKSDSGKDMPIDQRVAEEFDQPGVTLQWHDELSVGNDVIDNDHKRLIETVNQAKSGFHEKNHEKLVAAFEELSTFGSLHFKRVELTASKVGYPKVKNLQDSHIKLHIKMCKIREQIGSSWSDDIANLFMTLLRDWLIQHVIKENLLMKPWMVKYPPTFNPSGYSKVII